MLDVVRGDHERIVDLLAECLAKRAKNRKDSWRNLRREITRHTMASEDILQPRLQRALGKPNPLNHVHLNIADRLINRIERLAFESEAWWESVRDLDRVMKEHIELEESQLHYIIVRGVDPKDLQAIGSKLLATQVA